MKFNQSERSTIGVEWELQIVDRQTLELTPAAPALIEDVKESPAADLIHGEMHSCMIELVSRKHRAVSECAEDMYEALDALRPHLEERGLYLAGGGSHPFSTPSEQEVRPTPRYEELVERTQYWGRQMVIFCTHVHVGIEDVEKVAPIHNALVSWLAVLQALAASSPFWDGIDTGYADNRAMMFHQLPTAGLPHLLDSWEQVEDLEERLKRAGGIANFNEVRWDVRPSPGFGTIEVRSFDSATNVTELRALSALVHALVETVSRDLDRGVAPEVLPRELLELNKWRASRFGTDADLVVNSAGDVAPFAQVLSDLLEWVRPAGVDLGCAEDLSVCTQMVGAGSQVSRIRAAFISATDLRGPVRHAVAELRAGRPLRAD